MATIKTLARGERLPKHTLKKLSYMTGMDYVYHLYNKDELIAVFYKPRNRYFERRIEEV